MLTRRLALIAAALSLPFAARAREQKVGADGWVRGVFPPMAGPGMSEFSPNDLLGLSELFRLAADNPQPMPGSVFVLVPVGDCPKLSRLLFAESVRVRG